MKSAKKTAEPLQSLSIEAASKLIGADRRVLTKAIEEAVEIEPTGYHGGNPRYALRDIVAALIEYKVSAVRARGGDAEPDELERQRIRLTRAKADMAEMQAAILKGTVHEAKAVEAVWTDHLMACRAKLLAMPKKLAPRVQGTDKITAIETEIDAAVTEALNELAAYDPHLVTDRYVSAHREELDTTAEVDGEPVE